jgi:hypothetical protein
MERGGKRPGAGRKSIAMEKGIRDLVSPYMDKAVETVVQILETGEKDADRISAAKLLLAYGYGNPKSEIDLNNNVKGSIPLEQWIKPKS